MQVALSSPDCSMRPVSVHTATAVQARWSESFLQGVREREPTRGRHQSGIQPPGQFGRAPRTNHLIHWVRSSKATRVAHRAHRLYSDATRGERECIRRRATHTTAALHYVTNTVEKVPGALQPGSDALPHQPR